MKRHLLWISIVITALFTSSLAAAEDIYVDDRAVDDTIDKISDALDDVAKFAKDSELRRRDLEDVEHDLSKLRDTLKELSKTARDGERVEGWTIVRKRDLERDLEDLAEDFGDFKRALRKFDDDREWGKGYDEVDSALSTASKEIRSLEDMVRDASVYEAAAAEPVVQGPVALDDSTFQALVAQVSGETYDDEKAALVIEVAKHSYLSAAQIETLLGLLTYDDERVKLAIAVYPACADPEKWFTVYNAFTYDDSKDQVRNAI